MLELVYGYDEEVARFIASFGATGPDYGRCKTIGVVEDGQLIAGLVYFNYDPDAAVIELGTASSSPRWLNRVTYRRMFEYPFIECGCQMLIVRVRADNAALLSVLARMNFNLTYVPRMYGRDADGVLGTLTDDQWLDSNVARRLYRDARKRMEAA